MTQVTLATAAGEPPIEGVESRPVGRSRRFVLTRFPLSTPKRTGAVRFTDWTITHVKTGRSLDSVVNQVLPRQVQHLAAVVKAWEALEGVDWSVLDELQHGALPKDIEASRAVGRALRAAANEVTDERLFKKLRL